MRFNFCSRVIIVIVNKMHYYNLLLRASCAGGGVGLVLVASGVGLVFFVSWTENLYQGIVTMKVKIHLTECHEWGRRAVWRKSAMDAATTDLHQAVSVDDCIVYKSSNCRRRKGPVLTFYYVFNSSECEWEVKIWTKWVGVPSTALTNRTYVLVLHLSSN